MAFTRNTPFDRSNGSGGDLSNASRPANSPEGPRYNRWERTVVFPTIPDDLIAGFRIAGIERDFGESLDTSSLYFEFPRAVARYSGLISIDEIESIRSGARAQHIDVDKLGIASALLKKDDKVVRLASMLVGDRGANSIVIDNPSLSGRFFSSLHLTLCGRAAQEVYQQFRSEVRSVTLDNVTYFPFFKYELDDSATPLLQLMAAHQRLDLDQVDRIYVGEKAGTVMGLYKPGLENLLSQLRSIWNSQYRSTPLPTDSPLQFLVISGDLSKEATVVACFADLGGALTAFAGEYLHSATRGNPQKMTDYITKMKKLAAFVIRD